MDGRRLVPIDLLEHALRQAINNRYMPDDVLIPPAPPSPTSTATAPNTVSAAPQQPPAESQASSSSSSDAATAFKCQWEQCTRAFSDPETLYNHLCNDHIGRKSTNNLCLTCKWKDCTVTCAKRDHITSHMRGTSTFPSLVVPC